MDPFSLAALALGGAVAYSWMGRSKERGLWIPAFEEASTRLRARISPGSLHDIPELRALVDNRQVMLRVRGIGTPEGTIAIAEAHLQSESLRLFLGWDVSQIRDEIAYIPEVPFPGVLKLHGKLNLRADDPIIAERFLTHASNDLLDARKVSAARAMELLARGGTLRMAVHGLRPSATAIERLVVVCARFATALEAAASGVELPPVVSMPEKKVVIASPPEVPMVRPSPNCGVCNNARAFGPEYVKCKRCEATYHKKCWTMATGCVADGCDWTRADPL